MSVVYAILLTLVNLGLWVAILFNLPGTWLMVLFALLLAWWQPGQFTLSWTLLCIAVGIAVLGEVLEFALGAAGTRRAGSSSRASGLALVGGFIGGILGTALPVPLLGTLIGACAGAFSGALIGDLWAGRTLFQSVTSGQGAAVGRFWGTIAKLAAGAVIVVLLAVAAFF